MLNSGSQIKSIEDDPSITPGSVATRSPLSINPTPKDADIFSNAASKNSPTELPSLGLTSSSTWSFNPSSSNQNFPSWSDNTQQEIWSSMNKTSRGPPPGLGSNKCGSGGGSVPNVTNVSNANVWLSGGRTSGGWSGTSSNWNSNWLLLKNLTAQIDSSTLRTLCMQHGPLIHFHLYLNQGIALCKYATREEASKAQMTLNSCFLGNTTIIAESPSENEVHSILHHLPQQNSNTTATQQQAQLGQASSHCNTGAVNNSGGGSSNLNSNNANNVSNASISQIPSTTSGNVNGANSHTNNPSNNSSNVNLANNGSNNANSGQNGNQQSSHNSHPNTIPQNTTNTSANITNAATNPSTVNTNAGWRSTAQQQQQLQNSQTRPTGARDDFEFISKYVCSIVDD